MCADAIARELRKKLPRAGRRAYNMPSYKIDLGTHIHSVCSHVFTHNFCTESSCCDLLLPLRRASETIVGPVWVQHNSGIGFRRFRIVLRRFCRYNAEDDDTMPLSFCTMQGCRWLNTFTTTIKPYTTPPEKPEPECQNHVAERLRVWKTHRTSDRFALCTGCRPVRATAAAVCNESRYCTEKATAWLSLCVWFVHVIRLGTKKSFVYRKKYLDILLFQDSSTDASLVKKLRNRAACNSSTRSHLISITTYLCASHNMLCSLVCGNNNNSSICGAFAH